MRVDPRGNGNMKINNYWSRLSKMWFVSGEEINYLQTRRLMQVIDLWDTDKSRYFAITEFDNRLYFPYVNH